MKKYYFLLCDHNKDEHYEEYERPQSYGWYPSRNDAIKAAQQLSIELEQYGLFVDWINEVDMSDHETASIPYGDYVNYYGAWFTPHVDQFEYKWDEE